MSWTNEEIKKYIEDEEREQMKIEIKQDYEQPEMIRVLIDRKK